ncbi:MAG: carboxypeptidase regulatory-like domain-containing protein [Acidobacteriaceae bacterium]
MKKVFFLFSICFVAVGAFAGITGSISGTVKDTTGSVLPGAAVRARNVDTGVATTTSTNRDGSYSFPDLPIGHYNLQVEAKGFAVTQETGIVLDVNSALRLDVALQLSSVQEKVEVQANAVQVDTISTQVGDVIGSTAMTSLPLNGRAYTDLLALQPGVAPQSNESTNGLNSYSNAPPSGGLNDGSLSISGARGSSNGFMVNGGNVQEQLANGTSIIPNVDSIDEFRIITNNFDAEYGHYSGGLVNVITKSGTNQFHGNAFEFLRNTNLDARNFFSPTRGVYHQNQFGGTLGGRIISNKLFFFGDYQGTRQTIGESTGLIPVPSPADRTGNLSDQAGSLTGTVVGPAVATKLSQGLGYPVSVGEPFYAPGCTSATCVFPNAVIPSSVWSAPAANIFPFIPLPNVAPSANFPTGAYTSANNSAPVQDDKAGFRLDTQSRFGMLSGYYFVDKYSLVNPLAGGSFGNFGGATSGQAQLFTLNDTKSIGASSVNEFRLSYTRNASFANQATGPAADLGSLGFTTGCNTLGICPQSTTYKTLPPISLNSFSVGGPAGSEGLTENTFQVQDNYSWTLGTHNVKFGGIFSFNEVNLQTYFGNNGIFGFNGGTETGLDFADLLLGATNSYEQGVQLPLYNRGLYYGIFGQDSWRVRQNLTVNYGLRWDVTTPWWEKYNRIEALVPGRQSVVFPGSPVGWLVGGDPSIPRTVAPVQYGNFAPRIGFAYSPDPKEGFWARLLGGAGQSSIRASFGLFYNDLEDYTNANGNGDAPYGLFWVSPTPAEFATPFVDIYTGNQEGQRFPVPAGVGNATASHPDASVNWAQYEPISSSPTYYYKNVVPYGESWVLSVQRQLAKHAVMTVNYVGTAGRHNIVIDEANPATPSLCLALSQPSEVAPGSNVCGPFAETGLFTTAAGQTVQARQELGPSGGVNFGSTGWFRTQGTSSYNALEGSLQYMAGRTSVLVAYTYSKSLDDSSAATEQIQPFDPSLERALSAFNVKHNFVTSYSYQIPFEKAYSHASALTKGWTFSGITRFSTGFPVTIAENDDRSLIGNTSVGPTGSADEPNVAPGKVLMQTNPRKGGTYFNTALFTPEILGQFGNAKRRFFSGPGINNWDMALAKNLPLHESMSLEFRAEFFNIFNHAQFQTPSGLINSSSFGVVTSAADPRIGQVAAKFNF